MALAKRRPLRLAQRIKQKGNTFWFVRIHFERAASDQLAIWAERTAADSAEAGDRPRRFCLIR